MKKYYKIFFIILISLVSLKVFAQDLTEKEVITAAENFIKTDKLFDGYRVDNHKDIMLLIYKGDIIGYVVSLTPKGYIIFTASKNTYPIFGYSTEGNFNSEKTPALNILLGFMYDEKNFIEHKVNNNLIRRNNSAWEMLLSYPKIYNKTYDYQYGYWVKTVWGGVNCYDENHNPIYVGNYYTPNHYSPGCVATALSQVLKYYNWPPRGTNTHTDYDNSGNSTGSYYAKFVATEYQWNKMLDEYLYKHSTDEQRKAMGLLSYHCAIATDMDFEYDGSTSNINRIPNALSSYFRFVGHYESRSWSNFVSRLQKNLEHAQPVILSAKSDNGDEHAFVCDGYRYNEGEEKYYHLNMGWWNAYGLNGWYRIFGDFNVGGYNTITGGVFDIVPKPYMNRPLYTDDAHSFYIRWRYPKNLNVTAFQLEESYNNGGWTIISNSITDTFFLRTVTNDGLYKYRVKAQIDGIWYADSYSNYINVPVGKIIYLYFDGDDSFFARDNIFNDLDVDSSWTFETWVKVDSYNDNDWSVIMDRRTVFSLYLINDYDADFAVRFAVRDDNGNILTSLRSDSSDVNLHLGQWFHVAVSFDGTTARLFINGKLVDQKQDERFILTATSYAMNFAARYWGSYSRYLHGALDEIRISDIARYTQNFCPSRFGEFEKDKNTRLLLHLDNYTGTSLYDASNHILGITLRDAPNDANWQSSSSPIVLVHPKTVSVCGGTVKLGIKSYNASAYQWQIKKDAYFVDITDDTVFSGSQTDTLMVNASLLNGSNVFRCIIKNSSMFSCSEQAVINVFDNCTTWNGSIWSNGVPDKNSTAVIEANYNVISDLEAENIIIKTSDTLFVEPNYTLKTNYIENNGVLILKADSNSQYAGALIVKDIVNYGQMIAQKFIPAPNSVMEANQSIINSPLTDYFPFSQIYDEEVKILKNNGSPNSWQQVNYEGNMSNHTAYLFQVNSPHIISFNGDFNTGEITYTLHKGWNLLYNPYPCVVDWLSQEGWSKYHIQNVIYTLSAHRNNKSQNYSVFNSIVGINGANRYINAMQGFWVYAYDDNAFLSINDKAKVKTSNMQNSFFSIDNYLRFEFTDNDSLSDEAIIYFSTDTNNSFKLYPLTDNKFYTYILDKSLLYSIFTCSHNVPDTTISIGFKTFVSGEYTFRIRDFNFTVPVVLEDKFTDNTVILTQGSEYSFHASRFEPVNRFRLHFGDYQTFVDGIDNDLHIYSDGYNIFVYTSGEANISVMDVTGRKIYSNNFISSIVVYGLKSGIYIVSVRQDNLIKTKKIIIQ